jgi:hypothetical protein
MNIDFKIALIRNFGSQLVASRRLRIKESKLSHLVRGHDEPNQRERALLAKALGHDYFADVEEPRANVSRGVADLLASESGSMVVIAGTAPKSPKESE